MSINAEAGNSLLFYTGTNFAGASQSVAHGVTGSLATGNDSWTYKSVAMSAMHAFCWSEVNTADASRNYQNHTESLITANIADLTALYTATAFPLFYLGIDPALATPVWLDMGSVTGEMNALAATSVVGGATTSITTLSRPGLEGVAGFVGLTAGSSVVASCSYGAYDDATGKVAWRGLNAGTLVLEYTGGAVMILSATGFPDGWTFSAPAMQPDGSWKITVEGGAASGNTLTSLTSDKTSISNNGTDSATLTATVTDGSGLPASGVTVSWSATPGGLSAATSVTDTAGQAAVTLTDTGDTGACVVTASLDNGSMKSVSVALTDDSGGDVTLVSVTSDKESIVNDGGDQAYLTATVQDGTGNPAQNVTVSWATDLGTLNHRQQATDATGQSHAKLSDLGDTGTAVVTASLPDGSSMYVKIAVEESGGGLIISSLTSDKTHIANDGADTATLTATVTDSAGAAAAGVTVSWGATQGDLSASSSVTDSAGQASVGLTDTRDTGTITVTASLNNGISRSLEVITGNFASGCETFETCLEQHLPVGESVRLRSGMTITVLLNRSNNCYITPTANINAIVMPLSWGRMCLGIGATSRIRFDIGGHARYLKWEYGYLSLTPLEVAFYNERDEEIGQTEVYAGDEECHIALFTAPLGRTFTYFIISINSASFADNFVWGY